MAAIPPVPITYLEFYSGIGGWGYALKEAIDRLNQSIHVDHENVSLNCLGAFDHSDLCNKVFRHNFPATLAHTTQIGDVRLQREAKKRKKSASMTKPVSIESLTKEQLEEKNAFVWMMSPPCQPHTRQHENQNEDMQDPRSKSFLHLCQMISLMDANTLPRIIMLENVVGFEGSSSCMAWRKALRSRNYSVAHFHLNPTQCGIPNDRPRHYALAVLLESLPSNSASDVEGKSRNDDKNILNWFEEIKDTNSDKLEDSPPINTSMKALGVNEPGNLNILSPISDYLDPNDDNELDVPNKILNSNSSWCFDILTPSDRRSACFTSSYGKFVRGTGSVLYQTDGKNNESDQALDVFRLVKPEGREFDKNWKEGLDLSGNLRYFSSTEIARLFGFPVAPSTANEQSWMFRFPADCTMKQKWRLLGNSINVKVASQICEAGLRLVNQFS